MSLDTTDATADTAEEQLLRVTEVALTKVLEVRDGEDDPATLALRIEVTGVSGPEYTYDLAFEPLEDAEPDDYRQRIGDLYIVIPADSVDSMRGATLDVPSAVDQSGLVIRNPNRPSPLTGVTDLTLEGDTADRVQQMLTQVINPSLGAHGGFATLVGVDDGVAYLTMGGGCHGCSMSQATMVQGIATTLRESIPEITEVVDATDHSLGENPFYT